MSDLAAILARLPDPVRRKALSALKPNELAQLEYAWEVWARPDQIPPEGDWLFWLLLAGRGAGKTRSAAEWVRAQVETGKRGRIGIIGPTSDTIRRDVVEGPSGILAVSPPWFRPTYEPSVRRVVWPNGAVAHLHSSEEPDRIRGGNWDGGWGDEFAAWDDPQTCLDMASMALRITGPKGDRPRMVISTTPRNIPALKNLMRLPQTVVTRAKTMDNLANLDSNTVEYLTNRYAGTTLGRQELDGEILEDLEGALWNRAMLEKCRVSIYHNTLRRVVVAIDPAGGASKANDETGIIAAGRGVDGHGYLLADSSGRFSPDGWARRAVTLYHSLNADRIVAEGNFGGAMVEATIRAIDPNVPVRMVTASRGKAVRAEPIVALYEQQRVHHIGNFPELEDQLCSWCPLESGPSPDRLDALVWALTDLMHQHAPMNISNAAMAASRMSAWMQAGVFPRSLR